MNPWELMFLQSKVNNNAYYGDSLAPQNWTWPQETWFQERLRRLRKKPRETQGKSDKLPCAADGGPAMALHHPREVPVRLLEWTTQQGGSL
jgi:hypothetical protein